MWLCSSVSLGAICVHFGILQWKLGGALWMSFMCWSLCLALRNILEHWGHRISLYLRICLPNCSCESTSLPQNLHSGKSWCLVIGGYWCFPVPVVQSHPACWYLAELLTHRSCLVWVCLKLVVCHLHVTAPQESPRFGWPRLHCLQHNLHKYYSKRESPSGGSSCPKDPYSSCYTIYRSEWYLSMCYLLYLTEESQCL